MLALLYEHIEKVAAVALFSIGFTTLLLNKNMIRKIIGFSMIDSAIYLFLASYGYIRGREVPIYTEAMVAGAESIDPLRYVNPMPAALVLTGIVVSVSVTAIMLGLTLRLYRRYRTLDIDQIAEMVREEGK